VTRIIEGDQNRTPSRRWWEARTVADDERRLLERDSAAFYHQVLSTPCLAEVIRAEGPWLTLADGRRVLDFHGNSVHQVGYGHPGVVSAVTEAAASLPFSARRFANRYALELAERLIELAPGELRGASRVLLVPSGARTVSFTDSFHGASLDAASVGGQDLFRHGLGPLMPGVTHVLPPGDHRCAHCAGVCSAACAGDIERELASGDVAAVIAEPVRATTVEVPPADFWHRVRAACDRTGTLLIFDEIPTGLGPSGRLWVSERLGVTPDILVVGKGLGGGLFPQAGVIGRAAYNDSGATPLAGLAIGHYTHEKSPLGSAAALAVLGILEQESLPERAERVGAAWESELRGAISGCGAVTGIRRLGLMVAIEIGGPAVGGADTAADLADRVMYASLKRGLSFKVGGGTALVLAPPLNIEETLLSQATGIIAESLEDALADRIDA